MPTSNTPAPASRIAGRAHGQKPPKQAVQLKRYYPQLGGKADPDVTRAITTLYDYSHELRSQVEAMQTVIDKLTPGKAPSEPKS